MSASRTCAVFCVISMGLASPISGCGDAPSEQNSGMVSVPGGSAWVGCDATLEQGCTDNESPRFNVTVEGFEVDPTEVDVDAYVAFLNLNGNDCSGHDCAESFFDHSPVSVDGDGVWSSKPDRGTQPMTAVSWYGANAYCRSVDKRLCSEVEWEIAALGNCDAGNCEGEKPLYPWGNEAPSCTTAHMVLNSKGCDTGELAPVGSYPAGASPYGALDMAGNAWEWVADTWREDYTDAGATPDAHVDANVPFRVVRGGGLGSGPDRLRGSHRFNAGASDKPAEYGFRCCR